MHLINLQNIDKEFISRIFKEANFFKSKKQFAICCGYTLANVFFEPSTRTSLSFEVAMKKLGGHVIYFQKDYSSMKKGESIYDTLKTIESYADIIVFRHPDNNIIYSLKDKINIPIINGGNGSGEHPTQALLDLFTIHERFNIFTTDPIKLLFIGDIKHSRTIHSLHYLLKLFENISVYFYSYPGCKTDYMDETNSIYNFDNISDFDVVYCTRIQKERFDSSNCNIQDYIIDLQILSKMKNSSIILHPLPRNEEINEDVDQSEKALYFKQMYNGVFVRMALIDYYLNTQ